MCETSIVYTHMNNMILEVILNKNYIHNYKIVIIVINLENVFTDFIFQLKYMTRKI